MFTIFKEHRGFGKQILMLAKDDLIKTYKGSVLGPIWAVMKPLFQLFVYWFAFAVGIRGGADRIEMGAPFFIFLMVGFIPWFFISDTINKGSKSIRQNKQFVTKVSFPVSVIMTYTTLSKFFIHLVLMALGYIYLVFAGYIPSIYNLQFFIYAPFMFIFFLVFLWSLAPMSAFSKDFENLITTIMAGLFWLSGIVYNSYELEFEWLRKILLFNPITYFVNGYRKAFICEQWFFEGPYPIENIIIIVEFVFLIMLGIFNYNRLRKRLPDVL
ncbi:MAG: ABC transporter permease [Acutalibacteraceae bacterium]